MENKNSTRANIENLFKEIMNTNLSKIGITRIYLKLLLLISICFSSLMTSCSGNKANSQKKLLNSNVTIGAVLSTSNVVNFDKVDRLGELLNSELPGLSFKGDETSNYAEAIAKICRHDWDLSLAFSPIVASRALECGHTALHPAFVYEQKPLDKNTYFVGFIVKKDSDLNSLEDIEGKSLALKQRHSASGFYIPLSMLYGKTLAKVGFLGTENEVARNVLNGNYDVGVTAMNNESIVAFGKLNQNLKLIARSEDIPGGALLVSNKLAEKIGSKNYNSLIETLKQESIYQQAPKINTKDGDAYLYHPKYPSPIYQDFFKSITSKIDSIGDCYLNTPAQIFDCHADTTDSRI